MLSTLGQELMNEVTSAELQLLRDAAEAHDGRVLKSLGDGVIAVFSSAADVLDAAARVHRSIGDLNETGRYPVPIRVRALLAASHAVLLQDDVLGVAPVHAARLERLAGAGETICTEVVRFFSPG